MPRLFVAVWPPDDILDSVAALDRPDVPGLRWTRREQWHVTLRFLGRVETVDEAATTLATVKAAATTAVVGPAVGRFGQRVLHVPVAGLAEVAEAVVAATAAVGEPPEDRPFAGHLTLARVARGAKVDLRSLAGQPVAGRWRVGEVCLVESHLSPRGPRYEVVSRFPLTGAG